MQWQTQLWWYSIEWDWCDNAVGEGKWSMIRVSRSPRRWKLSGGVEVAEKSKTSNLLSLTLKDAVIVRSSTKSGEKQVTKNLVLPHHKHKEKPNLLIPSPASIKTHHSGPPSHRQTSQTARKAIANPVVPFCRCWSCSPIAYLHAKVETPDLEDLLRVFECSRRVLFLLLPCGFWGCVFGAIWHYRFVFCGRFDKSFSVDSLVWFAIGTPIRFLSFESVPSEGPRVRLQVEERLSISRTENGKRNSAA